MNTDVRFRTNTELVNTIEANEEIIQLLKGAKSITVIIESENLNYKKEYTFDCDIPFTELNKLIAKHSKQDIKNAKEELSKRLKVV